MKIVRFLVAFPGSLLYTKQRSLLVTLLERA